MNKTKVFGNDRFSDKIHRYFPNRVLAIFNALDIFTIFCLLGVQQAIAQDTSVWTPNELLPQFIDWHDRGHYDSVQQYIPFLNQLIDKKDTSLVALFKIVGDGYYELGNYKQALVYYQFARNAQTNRMNSTTVKLCLTQGHAYNFLDQFTLAKSYADSAKQFYDLLTTNKNLRLLASIHLLEGNIHYFTGKYELAQKSYEGGLHIYDSVPLPPDKNEITISNNLVLCLGRLSNHKEALKVSQKILPIAEELFVSNPRRLNACYINFANTLLDIGNIEEAIFEYTEVLKRCESQGLKTQSATVHNDLSALYIRINQGAKALYHANKSIEMYRNNGPIKKSVLITPFNNLAVAYNLLGENAKVTLYLDTCLQIANQIFPKFSTRRILPLLNLAKHYIAQKQWDIPAILTQEVQQIVKRNFPEGHIYFIEPLLLKVSLMNKTNQLDSTDHYLDQIKNLIQFDEKVPFNELLYNPGDLLLFYLQHKYEYYIKKYEIEASIEFLDSAYATNAKEIEWIEFLKQYYHDDLFTTRIHENAFYSFENGVATALKLFEFSKDKQYLENALNLIEKTKSFKFNQELNLIDNARIGLVEYDIIVQEKALSTKISKLENALFALEMYYPHEVFRIDSLTKELQATRHEKIQFIDKLLARYPQYAALKFNHKELHIAELKPRILVDQNTFLLSYLEGADSIYAIIIGKDSIDYWSKPYPHHYQKLLKSYQNLLEYPSPKNTFDSISHAVYKILFEETDYKLGGNKMIILSPSGNMSSINFETLKNNDGKYLLELYDIYPIYSISSCLSALDKNDFTIESQISFWPNYQNPTQIQQANFPDSFAMEVLTGSFPLHHNFEFASLNQSISGETVIGSDANKSKFLRASQTADLIHLSAHAQFNNSLPLNSYIIFENDHQDIHDSLLKLFEVYGLNMRSKFVMLSACNTAKGKMVRGEGLMNWSHAMEKAGVPLTGMALWAIPEKATSRLLSSFYAEMFDHKTLNYSLRKAKLDFLNRPVIEEYRHPFYWGGIVIYGPPVQLIRKNGSSEPWWILAFMGFVCIYLFVKPLFPDLLRVNAKK